MIVRWWIVTTLQLIELFVSSLVHLSYGLYIFSTAVAGDVSQTLSDWIFKPNFECSNKETKSSKDLPPIVLVHGIFGFGKGRLGGFSYFAGAEKKDDRVLVPDLGSLTSIYDRARELFYYLKGGQVDYGEEHSMASGHSQFGRVYEQGNYPEWEEDHPIHFVGHSAGAQVVRVLQQMLADKAFKGYENTSENWVLSVTALSGALNGTTRTYFDGMQPEDGKSLMPVSLLQLCRIGVIVYEWLDIPWLKDYYNFGFDHFSMTWRRVGIRGLRDYLSGNAGPFASGDWILPDLTIQGSIKLNGHLRTFPQTYYFSYATKHTTKVTGLTVPSAILGVHPLLFIRFLQMSRWRHPQDVSPPYKGYRDEDWWDNDGALNTISMTHPRLPVEHPSHLVIKDSDCQLLQPGIWYYKIVEGDHILYVVNRERAGVQFDLIYDSIFERCRKHILRKNSTLPNQIPLLNMDEFAEFSKNQEFLKESTSVTTLANSKRVCLVSSSNKWVIDSGATNHMTEEHVEPETNGGLQEGIDQEEHVEPETNGGLQEGIDQEEHVQPETNGGLQEGMHQEEHGQPETNGGLQEGFYQQTCPQAEKIIKDGLVRAFQNDSTISAAIPRLFLHDCFVNGCDGSILLDTTPSGGKIEKLAPTNGITVKGYELIDEIKAELEENCPGIVSCSDILAYLSRDAFVTSGLPHYEVSGGRRDGMESLEENIVGNHPLPDDTVDKMIDLFKKKGLNAEDLVVLIGAHSIGVAHCFNFLYRLDIPEEAQMVDPRLSSVMRSICTNQMSTMAFDTTTQYKMDSTFYKQLLMKRGLLESDQVLAQDIRTRGLVQQLSNDEMGWFDKFGKAMNKLGAIEVLTGNQGQIRKQCRAVNL